MKREHICFITSFPKINSNSHSNPKQIAEQDIITQLDSINIDDFLVFSDDESTKDVVVEEEDDVLLEQCLQILDVSPNEAFSISNAYFICGYITSSLTPLSDLKRSGN